MLGFDVSERTVSRYLPRRPLRLDAVQRWLVFLHNHRDAVAAMDFFVVPTVTFRILYVWLAIEHGRRRLLRFAVVTDHPAANWVIQQLREAFPFDTAPRHLIFDRDSIFSASVVSTVKSFGIKPATKSSPVLDRQRKDRTLEAEGSIPFSSTNGQRQRSIRAATTSGPLQSGRPERRTSTISERCASHRASLVPRATA